jgi:hypothetical protein
MQYGMANLPPSATAEPWLRLESMAAVLHPKKTVSVTQ